MQMCPKCSWNNFDTAKFCANCGEPLRGLLGQGEILQGRYRIIKVLGCGGMGSVYYAEDLRLNNRPVAVKENFDSSPEAASQFRIEAELLATLRHPNLPQVFDYFIEPKTGKQYLVMDYIAGDDLEDIVEKRGPLDERNALRIMFQVFDAVDYLHRQNPPVIHRDIKPSNIKVQPDGTSILVDFGIAKRYLPGRETMGAAAAVTPGYSPPEQYGQGITDQRSDIYALGATLYFALTGQVPPEAIERVTHGDKLIPPSRINPRVSMNVEQGILKAMSIRPIDRFSSVMEFKQALMMPSVSRPTPTYRPQTQPQQIPSPKPSPYRRHRRPRPVPSNYNLEVGTIGCISTFAEILLWAAIIWAILGGCRGCLFIGFVFLLANFLGWQISGWTGIALATVSVWSIWHLIAKMAQKLVKISGVTNS
ncbi:MAG: serine/threonine-protein kinase [Armatimonadetes bacterium]|nr:serine/threonine-protein kinase [Armatimonadota bacterium]MDW8029651.1 serine/threonine-protein kinase [Armatimonadota bacterium]